MGHIDAFVVDAGPVPPIFQITPSRQETSLLTAEKSKNPQLLQNQDISRDASVGVKYLNMRNFRLLGHIPQFLVDDEALSPFLFSLQIQQLLKLPCYQYNYSCNSYNRQEVPL